MLRLLRNRFRPVRVDASSSSPEASPVALERAARRRLLFCHVPKTAGTTLRSFIEQHYPLDTIFSARQLKQRLRAGDGSSSSRNDRGALDDIAFVYGHYNARSMLPDDFRSITILRDPIERVRSLYRHWGQFTEYNLINSPAPQRVSELKRLSRTMPIEQFIQLDEWPIRRHYHDGMTKSLVLDGDQRDASSLEQADLLARAMQTLDDAMCVGVTDRFDDFVRLMCFHMHWPPPPDHERLNMRATPGAAPGDEATRRLIASLNPLDAQVFEHGRDVFERQFRDMVREVLDDGVDPDDPALGAKLHESLDRRAREHFVELARDFRPPQCISLEMRMPLRGTGWLEREGLDIDRPYRWTGPDHTATFDCIMRPARRYRVRVAVISVIDEEILRGAQIAINGQPALELHIEDAPSSRVLVGEFDGDAVAGDHFLRLSITVPRTATHLEVHPDCGDARRKGLAVESIAIEASS